MLSRCANSECGKPFIQLREGKLFVVEKGNRIPAKNNKRSMEHFWLCDECATTWTVAYDLTFGLSLIPLKRPMSLAGAEGRTAKASVRPNIRQS
ncbi:MAG TPA: hypothetical protein VGG04_01480 [Candidatus Sulfotelmatobacter sp.]